LKGIFFLGFFGWAILEYLLNKIGSGSSVLHVICGFILVIGIGYFFILPLLSDMESQAKKNTNSISTIITDDPSQN